MCTQYSITKAKLLKGFKDLFFMSKRSDLVLDPGLYPDPDRQALDADLTGSGWHNVGSTTCVL